MKNKLCFFVINFALLFAFGTSFAVSTDAATTPLDQVIEGVPSGDRFTKCKSLFKVVGCSSFINLCYDTKLKMLVIIKSMPNTTRTDISNEIAIFKHIKEFKLINTINLFDVVTEEEKTFLILQYAKGRDLHRYVCNKKPKINTVKELLFSAIEAIQELHNNKIAHLDIKLDNFFIEIQDNGDAFLKIADFGLAEYLPKGSKASMRKKGTPEYMAPEVYHVVTLAEKAKGEPYYDPFKADIYSMGVMFYVAITGEYPYSKPSANSLRFNYLLDEGIEELIILNNHRDKFDDGSIELLKRMMKIDPSKRSTARELLEDPWFSTFKENNETKS